MRFIKAKHLKVGDEVLFPQDEVEELHARVLAVKVYKRRVDISFEMVTNKRGPLKKEEENESIELEKDGKCLLIKRLKKNGRLLSFRNTGRRITDTAGAIQLLEDIQQICNDSSLSASERLVLARTRLCICKPERECQLPVAEAGLPGEAVAKGEVGC